MQNPAAKIAASAAKGQTYGEAGKQIAAQKAVPMGSAPTDVQAAQVTPMPGQIADLTGATERPTEPITAGMDFGPGPSSAVFGPAIRPEPGSNRDLAEQVRAIASLYPNPALLQLVMDLQA